MKKALITGITGQSGSYLAELLQIDGFHDEYKWINEQSELYHDAVNHPLSLMNLKNKVR